MLSGDHTGVAIHINKLPLRQSKLELTSSRKLANPRERNGHLLLLELLAGMDEDYAGFGRYPLTHTHNC